MCVVALRVIVCMFILVQPTGGARTPNRGFTGPLTVSGTVAGTPTISQDFVDIHHIQRALSARDSEQIWSRVGTPDNDFISDSFRIVIVRKMMKGI